MRGARRPDGTTLILLSAATPGGTVFAQREIPAKTNEVPQIGPMLREPGKYNPPGGHVLTADALHATEAFANLAGEPAAGAVLTVKDNQPALRALPENALRAHAAACVTADKGRAGTRSHLVMNAPDEVRAQFPSAGQIARVIRTRTVTSWASDGHTRTSVTRTSIETACLIITMTARKESPAHIATYAASTGASGAGFTGSAMSRPVGTLPGSGPAPGPASCLPCVTLTPGSSARPAARKSPPPPPRRARQRPAPRPPPPRTSLMNSGKYFVRSPALHGSTINAFTVPRAFPPCCCPLAVSRPGKAGGPETSSFRTSTLCESDPTPS